MRKVSAELLPGEYFHSFKLQMSRHRVELQSEAILLPCGEDGKFGSFCSVVELWLEEDSHCVSFTRAITSDCGGSEKKDEEELLEKQQQNL